MRTEAAINTFLDQAMIAYSYKVQQFEERRQRGLLNDSYELLEASNIFDAIQVSTDEEKNLFCDVLTRMGFILNMDSNIFTEEIYNENFDIV